MQFWNNPHFGQFSIPFTFLNENEWIINLSILYVWKLDNDKYYCVTTGAITWLFFEKLGKSFLCIFEKNEKTKKINKRMKNFHQFSSLSFVLPLFLYKHTHTHTQKCLLYTKISELLFLSNSNNQKCKYCLRKKYIVLQVCGKFYEKKYQKINTFYSTAFHGLQSFYPT